MMQNTLRTASFDQVLCNLDRHRFDADPDPTLHLDADPNPDSDPDSTSKYRQVSNSDIFNTSIHSHVICHISVLGV
jgi:hypothetical protein